MTSPALQVVLTAAAVLVIVGASVWLTLQTVKESPPRFEGVLGNTITLWVVDNETGKVSAYGIRGNSTVAWIESLPHKR